jgi:hypothetical protein
METEDGSEDLTSRGDGNMSRNPVKLRARVEKKWVLSVGGVDVPMTFVKKDEMAGMALLVSPADGSQMVVNVPDNFASIMSEVLGLEKDFEVTVVKASKMVHTAVREAYKMAAVKVADGEETVEENEQTPPAEQELGPIETPEDKGDGNAE